MRHETQQIELFVSHLCIKFHLDTRPPIAIINTLLHIAVKTGIRPIARRTYQPMFYRIVMNIFFLSCVTTVKKKVAPFARDLRYCITLTPDLRCLLGFTSFNPTYIYCGMIPSSMYFWANKYTSSLTETISKTSSVNLSSKF